MTIEGGQSLLHYRLVDKIGEGGMGAVWRATDATLGREVALKFLPPALAADPERLQRFEREAKVLASLNHPNIAAIYGLHEHDGQRFLAMELVPGEDLAQRLERGPIPVDEALDIARKVAEALETAHDQGIVHRDLKPANVRLAPDGTVKVLDFGLAKALDPVASASGVTGQPTMSPTITSLGTVVGVVLGTAAYMSPEQAKGKPVDRRTDIWAFGCLVHEMLTGRRLFQGETISEVLAAVIMAPLELDDLPAAVTPRVRGLVRRCLERDPRRRLRDIGEARFLLEEILAGTPEPTTSATPAAGPTRPHWILPAAVVGAALLATVATALVLLSREPAPPASSLRRFEIAAHGPFRSPNQSRLVGISPDGSAIAYVDDGDLLVRPLDRTEPIAIVTETTPTILFWAPDGKHLGYVAGDKLWKVAAGGGASTRIADIAIPMSGGSSAAWCPDDRILLGTGEGGLYRVSALGGDLEEFIPLDGDAESDIHDVSCLPDGSAVFVPHLTGGRPSKLVLWSDGHRTDLLKLADDQDIWFPVYSPQGYILFRRQPANSGVWAVPFSIDDHAVTGEMFMVSPGADVPSVSNDGTLVEVRGSGVPTTRLAWVGHEGVSLGPIGAEQQQWPFPELSPDGRRVAIAAKEGNLDDIWVHDVVRGTRTRLGVTDTSFSIEAWSPDGATIVYSAGTAPPLALKSKSADGGGEATTVGSGWGAAYSADGRYLLSADVSPDTGWDLFSTDIRGEGKALPLLKAPMDQLWPRLSPDGRMFAYVSNEGGGYEVYLKRFPDGEGKWQVSVGGGMWPRWSPRGDRLYYARGDTLMSVNVTTGADPTLGTPRELFTRPSLGVSLIFDWCPGFDVSDDGQRFVIVEPVGSPADLGGILVVENWTREFARPAR